MAIRDWVDSGDARRWREATDRNLTVAAYEIGASRDALRMWERTPDEVAAGRRRRNPQGGNIDAYYEWLVARRAEAMKTGAESSGPARRT
jgi:hypothetical protein